MPGSRKRMPVSAGILNMTRHRKNEPAAAADVIKMAKGTSHLNLL